MRKSVNPQPNLSEAWLELEHARELEAISALLDAHPKINELVLQDLRSAAGASARQDVGRGGMSAEQVLRAAVVKQLNGFSYRDLAFHLADSRSYRTFCRLGIMEPSPSKSTLAANIKALRPETFEEINRELVGIAASAAIDHGRKVRVDCTVVEANIHEPSDSELLYDCVRVLTRLMSRARELLGTDVVFGNRMRRAKRRRLEVLNAKNKEQRRRVYRDLLKVTDETYRSAKRVSVQMKESELSEPVERVRVEGIAADLAHFLSLTAKVIDQTRRRVIDDESVPAQEKIVSIFEEHIDIIRKDRRETLYGHKVCLTGGSSSMILDCVILEGNPADSTLAESMVDRQVELYGRAPRQVAYDGAFSSKLNLEAIKSKGVEDVAFAKAKGLAVTEMVKSSWVYQRLRRFRCGIEGVISFLKRVFGLDRCTWRSLPSFRSYVWASIVAANLLVMARHLIE